MNDVYVRELTIQTESGPLAQRYLPLLERAVVDQHVLLPAMFALTFRDPDHDVLGGAGFTIGATVTIDVTLEAGGAAERLFTGEVSALEAELDTTGSHVVVRGYDRSHRLHRGRKTRSWTQVKDSDVVSEIAGEAGIPVGTVEESPVEHEHLVQPNLTDWEFLTLRAGELGYDLTVVDGSITFRKPSQASDGPDPGTLDSQQPRQLVLGNTLYSFRPRLSAAEQVGTVEVRGWDPERTEAVVGTASATTTDADLEPEPATLASTFGNNTHVSVERGLATKEEVDAVAQALAERIGGASAEAEGTAEGDPGLRAGTPVSIGLVGHPFEGRYVVSASRHVFDRDGYRTHFAVSGREERSLLGLVSGGAGRPFAATMGSIVGPVVGVVTNVKDPNNKARVKLSLPWLSDDYETDWARLVFPGAGASRGVVVLPEVGDEVLVCFAHGDFRRPYVLGGLFNEPPDGATLVGESGQVDYWRMVSRSGHAVELGDATESGGIALRTGGSQKEELKLDASNHKITIASSGDVEVEGKNQGKVTIKAGTTLTIEATSSLTLKAPQITLDGTTQVAVKSGGQLQLQGAQTTLQGSAMTQIDGGPLLTIQGAIVKIN